MSLEDYGKHAITVGPWGGQGGINWDDGVYSTVRQILIAHGSVVDSVRIEYDLKGTSVWSVVHGGNGGNKTDKIKLNYPDEYLTSVNGYYGSFKEWGPVLVRSLTLESNKKTYGPYGIEQGTFFSLPTTQGKIVGFHGLCGWYLDAIGVHIQPLSKQMYSNSVVQYSKRYTANGTDANGYSMVQGRIGSNYDLVIALRYKDDQNNSVPSILSRQTSNSKEFSTNTETKPKKLGAGVVPSTIQKVGPATPIIERIPSREKEIEGAMTYGPWGGSGGTMFDDGIYDGVRQINISRNVGIVYIRVCYDKDGQAVWGSKNGGTGGLKTEKVVFEYPSEILTHITGYYGPAMKMGPNIIKSLTFHTTKGRHGPYGDEQGKPFSTKLREGMIAGFHGKKGLFVDAIGVHVVETNILPALIVPSKPSNQQAPISEFENPNWTSKLKRTLIEEGDQKVVKDPSLSGPGPWGGDGGKPWDDGVFTGIKQIILTRSEAICSLEIEYDRNGQSVWSVKHGGGGGQTTHQIKLEYPHEVLTRISGYYGPISKAEWTTVMKSLTFHTTRKKYGPFGEELGTFFTSTTTEGKVVGLHGRSSMYLDAIGVHLQHWFGNQKASKSSSLMKLFS